MAAGEVKRGKGIRGRVVAAADMAADAGYCCVLDRQLLTSGVGWKAVLWRHGKSGQIVGTGRTPENAVRDALRAKDVNG